jgi:flagellar protein FlbT
MSGHQDSSRSARQAGTMRLSLKQQERLFVNGAVLRVDRKVGIELLNDVTFLMESHVIQPEETTTPLRQLYFVVQTMLMDPLHAGRSRDLFDELWVSTMRSFGNRAILDGLTALKDLMEHGRYFDGLKLLRTLFPVEAGIIGDRRINAIRAA